MKLRDLFLSPTYMDVFIVKLLNVLISHTS